jgi:hypothetical protein
MKALPYNDEEENETLPKKMEEPLTDNIPYVIPDFVPVTEEMSDRETTVNDLSELNTQLALLHYSIPQIKTFDTLLKVCNVTCKLIETRRKVKKLPFGEPTGKGNGRGFEVVE